MKSAPPPNNGSDDTPLKTLMERLSYSGKHSVTNLDNELEKLRKNEMSDAEMLKTLNCYFEWVKVTAIEIANLGGSVDDFKRVLVPMLKELGSVFTSRNLEQQFLAIMEVHLAEEGRESLSRAIETVHMDTPRSINPPNIPTPALRKEDRPTLEYTDAHFSQIAEETMIPEESSPLTTRSFDIPKTSQAPKKPSVRPSDYFEPVSGPKQPERSLCPSPSASSRPTRVSIPVPASIKSISLSSVQLISNSNDSTSPADVLVPPTKIASEPPVSNATKHQTSKTRFAVVAVIGLALGVAGGSLVYRQLLRDNLRAVPTTEPSVPPSSFNRTSSAGIPKKTYRLAENPDLQKYVERMCKSGPPILCEALKEAAVKTSVEATSYENIDLRLKFAFLDQVEQSINSHNAAPKGKKTALEYAQNQRRLLQGYVESKKWNRPEDGILLGHVKPSL